MPCTTILVGKRATYDGSTIMARNEDSPAGKFEPKKFISVTPDAQPREYQSVISKVKITLPDNPMRYTAMPNALDYEGIWGEAGFNEENIAMSETETLTSNPRVLGADPLVKEGIGEEDMLTIVLPYIHSAREGVLRLGSLLEEYGTYEMNGIGFQDTDEIWWLETIGGHHWMAKRVPDDAYVMMPNQQGIDFFDFKDALTEQKNHMCCADLPDFVEKYHLDVAMDGGDVREAREFDARGAFGSRSDTDHVYNTPRSWFMGRYLNPTEYVWDGPDADFTPESDYIPWCLVPERKITIEDVKYVLSGCMNGTEFNPYGKHGNPLLKGKYRPIGINRNNFLAITHLRPNLPKEIAAVEWICVASNAFNQVVPFYANVNTTPAYLADVDGHATTENFYWINRLIGCLVDAHYGKCNVFVERYQLKMASLGHNMLQKFDEEYLASPVADAPSFLEKCNEELADCAQKETQSLLDQVLYHASNDMKNGFSKSDN